MSHNQLPLSFGMRQNYFSEDFVRSPNNEKALDAVMSWPHWPSYGLSIYGDEKVGKTHLSYIFLRHSKGLFVTMENIRDVIGFEKFIYPDKAYILDNAEDMASCCPKELFHFCNIIKERNAYLLILSNKPPVNWGIKLKDLESRLSVFPSIKVNQPDDDLFEALLVKKVSEMQIDLDPAVGQYILNHSERSAGFLVELLEKINHASFVQQRKITIPLVKSVLNIEKS